MMEIGLGGDGLSSESDHQKFVRSMQLYLLSTLGLDLHDRVSLPTTFLRTATHYSPRPALHDKQGETFVGITYGEMLNQINQFAAALIALNVAARQNVGIFLRNSSAWAIADFGIMFAGAVTVPIYETFAGGLIEFILAETETSLILVENKAKLDKIVAFWPNLPDLKYIVVVDPTDILLSDKILSLKNFKELGAKYLKIHPKAAEERYSRLVRDDVASIVYTSGSTGQPKGVMLTHRNFLSNVYGVMAAADVSNRDRFLSILPLCHVLERTVSHFTCLLTGGSMYYAESIKSVSRDMMTVRPTICIGVPRVFEKVYAAVQDGLTGSSPLKKSLFQWAIDVGREMNAIGWDKVAEEPIDKADDKSADKPVDRRYHHREEDLAICHRQPLQLGKRLAGKIAEKMVHNKIKAKLGGQIRFFISGGAPLNAQITTFFSNLGVFIFEGYGLTETTPIIAFNFHANFEAGAVGRLLPYVDVKFSPQGEVLVKGPNVMRGYYKNPAATAEVIDAEGFFHTGDIGCFTAQNNLKITGRIKEILVTSGGKNVPIGPKEAALNQSPLVSQSILLGDGRQFISCLIFPDFTALHGLARKHKVAATDVAALCRHETVLATYQGLVDEVNRPLSQYEQIKKFKLIPYELTIDSGEITPTLKVRRKEIMAKFAEQISAVYTTHGRAIVE